MLIYIMCIKKRIDQLGYMLPPPVAPVGSYLPVIENQGMVLVSGQLPMRDGALLHCGTVGDGVSTEEAREAAVLSVLCGLSAFYAHFETFEIIAQFLHMRGYVNATKDFVQHSMVIDAASAVLIDIFGDSGRHARAAVGVSSLPRNASVEIELMICIKHTNIT